MAQAVPIKDGYLDINGVSLYYETRGKKSHPALLMVNGMGAQMTYWPDSLCDEIASAGFYVIRFDNRDCGLSGDTQYSARFSTVKSFINYRLGKPMPSPYTLHNMVDDAVGVLDALGIDKAHWAGFSMGGMIVQIAAATYPERVHSVTSFMSTTNEPHLPGPTLNVLFYLLTVNESTVEGAIKARVKFMQMIGSPGYVRPLEKHLEYARNSIERSFRPKAGLLHKIAVLATGGFSHLSAKIQAPTLIIHGDKDPLVRVQGGKHCAKVIPNAHLKIIPGMGHNFPDELVSDFAQMMLQHMQSSSPTLDKAA